MHALKVTESCVKLQSVAAMSFHDGPDASSSSFVVVPPPDPAAPQRLPVRRGGRALYPPPPKPKPINPGASGRRNSMLVLPRPENGSTIGVAHGKQQAGASAQPPAAAAAHRLAPVYDGYDGRP